LSFVRNSSTDTFRPLGRFICSPRRPYGAYFLPFRTGSLPSLSGRSRRYHLKQSLFSVLAVALFSPFSSKNRGHCRDSGRAEISFLPLIIFFPSIGPLLYPRTVHVARFNGLSPRVCLLSAALLRCKPPTFSSDTPFPSKSFPFVPRIFWLSKSIFQPFLFNGE